MEFSQLDMTYTKAYSKFQNEGRVQHKTSIQSCMQDVQLSIS